MIVELQDEPRICHDGCAWRWALSLTPAPGACGSALNLNLHFHVIFLEGVYVDRTAQGLRPRFVQGEPPTNADIAAVVQKMSRRVLRTLRQLGYLEAGLDAVVATGYDPLGDDAPELARTMAASVQPRIAFGERAGQQVRPIGAGFGHEGEVPTLIGTRCASVHGFSLHTNTHVPAHRRDQLERLIRYMARGAVSLERLTQDANGALVYTFTHPWSDGTTGIRLSPKPEALPRAVGRWGGKAVLRPARTPSASRCSRGAATPRLRRVLHAPCPHACARVSHSCALSHRVHPSQPPPLRCASRVASAFVSVSSGRLMAFFSRLIAFESVPPPAAPTAPPAHHPSRAGPAAAVWRPALAAPGGRHGARVSWGRPRAGARGRQGGWAPAVAKAVPEPPQPRWRPGRRPGRALRRGPVAAGSRQGWPAAGVGASGPALARPAPGGQRGACGPTAGVGPNGRRVAGGGRTRAGGTA